MLSSLDCRARARSALANAGLTTNPDMKLQWEATAAEWAALAIQAEIQELAQEDLINRTAE